MSDQEKKNTILGRCEEDTHIIAKRCAFISHCIEEAGTLGGPEWMSAISILAFVEGSDHFIHRKLGHPIKDYRWVEMQEDINLWRKNKEPDTCESIQNDLGFTECPECPIECPVKSPVEWLSPRGRCYHTVLTFLDKEQFAASELLVEAVLHAWAEIFRHNKNNFFLLAQKLLEKDPEFRIDVFAEVVGNFK